MSKDYVTPVAKSIPFDKTGISYQSTNLQDVLSELRSRIVYTPQTLTATASTIDSLMESSSSLQIIGGGTVSGYSVQLPNGTTLFNGRKFEIANKSTSNVTIKDGTGATLFILTPDSVALLTLRSNSTIAGLWLQAVIYSVATGIQSINVVSSTAFSTSSTTDVAITGFSTVPGPGTWAVWYSSDIVITGNNRTAYCSVYKNATQITDSERSRQGVSSNFVADQQTLTIVNTNETDVVSVRVRITSNTLNVQGRSLLLIRLGV